MGVINIKSITIIIPCRNEEKHISRCLDSVLAQTYPLEEIKVIVINGMSTDNTREIVNEYSLKYPLIKLFSNPKKITPCAMNIGINNANTDYLVIINSHAIMDRDFIQNAVEYSIKTGADAVGGMLKTVSEGNNIISKSIPLAADSRFGTGGNRYRTKMKEGFVKDTLPYNLYRKEVFDRIGLFDEDLIRDQDEELNYRLINNGGKIYYSPSIKSTLYIRSTLKKLWAQHYQYGYFKPLVIRKVGAFITWRQLIPPIFILGLFSTGLLSFIYKPLFYMFCIIGFLYLIVNIYFSLLIAIKNGWKYLLIEPVIFVILHFSYGIGYLKGLVDFFLIRKSRRKIMGTPLTR